MTKYQAKKVKPPTEKSIMLGIMSALGSLGWRVLRLPPSIYSGQKGVPDLLCIRWGIHAFIEVKSSIGKLSDQQRAYGELIDSAGGIYVVARNVDYAINILEAIEIAVFDDKGLKSRSMKPQRGMRLTVPL